jgi:hypothetical protein
MSKCRLRSVVWTVYLKCMDKLQEQVPHIKEKKEVHVNTRLRTVSDVQQHVHLTSVLQIVICADTANLSTYTSNGK